MKQNLFEEVKRIHEIMGINKKILLESQSTEPWIFSMIDDFLKTYFKDDNSRNRAFELLEEYEIKTQTFNNLTAAQKAEAKQDIDPNKWRRTLSDDEKKLLDAAIQMKRLGQNRAQIDELAEIVFQGQKKNATLQQEDVLKTFLRQIFENKETVEKAVTSFYNKNPKATQLKSAWTERKLMDFNSKESMTEWGNKLKQNIDNDNSIPDYLKNSLKDEIDNVVDSLVQKYERFLTSIMTEDIRALLKTYKLNINSEVELYPWWKAWDKSEFMKWQNRPGRTGIKEDTSVARVLKQLFQVADDNPDLNFKELVELAFQLVKYRGNVLTAEESISLVQKLYPTFRKGEGLITAWKSYVKENADKRYKLSDDEWLQCFNGFTFPKSFDSNIEVSDPVGVKYVLGKIGQGIQWLFVGSKEVDRFKKGKCGWIAGLCVSFIVYMITGYNLIEQIEELPNVNPVIKNILRFFIKYRTKDEKLEKVKELFPEISNLVYSESFDIKGYKKAIEGLFKDKSPTQEQQEQLAELEKAGEKFDGLLLKYKSKIYWIICDDGGDDKIFNDKSQYVYFDPQTKTDSGQLSSLISQDSQILSLNNFVGFVDSKYSSFDYSKNNWKATTEEVAGAPTKFLLYNGQNLLDMYIQDSTNQDNFIKATPDLNRFLQDLGEGKTVVPSENTTKYDFKIPNPIWKSGSSGNFATDCNDTTKYKVFIENNLYKVQSCKDQSTEIYTYDFKEDKFKFFEYIFNQ